MATSPRTLSVPDFVMACALLGWEAQVLTDDAVPIKIVAAHQPSGVTLTVEDGDFRQMRRTMLMMLNLVIHAMRVEAGLPL